MKRPIVYITISFILGIIAYNGSIAVSALCAAAVIGLSAFLIENESRIFWLALPLALILGFADSYMEDCIYIDYGEEKTFEGIVTEKDDNSFVFKDNDKFIVYTDTQNIHIGCKIIVKGIPEKPEKSTNPYGYNPYRVLTADSIKAIIYKAQILEISESKNILSFMDMLRKKAEKVFDENLTEDYSETMKAIITGNTSGLSSYTKELYKCGGMYHLLAISGMHIVIISGFIMFIFKPLGKSAASVISLVIIALYCIFTGMSIPTVRAVLTFSMMTAGRLYGRSIDDISLVCLAMLIMLIQNPFELFSISFQYSFCAAGSIALVHNPIYERIDKRYQNPFTSSVIITFSVCLCVKPITAYYFYYSSLADIPVNVLLSPFTSLLVAYGFTGCILGNISGILGKLIMTQVTAILSIFEGVFLSADKIPFLLIGRPSLFEIVLFYAAVFCMILYVKSRKKTALHLTVFLSMFLISALIPFSRYIGTRDIEVSYLSVGQGDCGIIRKQNLNFIIDCGDNYCESVSYLLANGQNSVDTVFISHSDDDHCRGFENTADKLFVKNVVLPDIAEEIRDERYNEIVSYAQKRGINVIYAHKGDSFYYNDLCFKVVSPSTQDFYADNNSSSMVVRAEYKDTSFLFTGDIPSEVENRLSEYDAGCDILKLAHHGSKYSSDRDFLSKANPRLAIISAGKYNNYSHPSAEVIKRLEEMNIDYKVTAQDGTITIISDGKNIRYKEPLN